MRRTIRVDQNGWMSIDVGPHASPPNTEAGLPKVGDHVFTGMWAIPSDVTAIRLTLDDGSVVTPDVVDVGSVAEVKLMVVGGDHGPHRSIAVDVERS